MPGTASRTASRRRSMSLPKWAPSDASPMITAIFENSDGCSWNGPSWNHACAPLTSVPNGEITPSSSRQMPP